MQFFFHRLLKLKLNIDIKILSLLISKEDVKHKKSGIIIPGKVTREVNEKKLIELAHSVYF